jgi:hypothetical protein
VRPSGGENKISREDGPLQATITPVSPADSIQVYSYMHALTVILYFTTVFAPLLVGRGGWQMASSSRDSRASSVCFCISNASNMCAMPRPSTGANWRLPAEQGGGRQLNERIGKSDTRFRSHSACHLLASHLQHLSLQVCNNSSSILVLQVCNSQSSPGALGLV